MKQFPKLNPNPSFKDVLALAPEAKKTELPIAKKKNAPSTNTQKEEQPSLNEEEVLTFSLPDASEESLAAYPPSTKITQSDIVKIDSDQELPKQIDPSASKNKDEDSNTSNSETNSEKEVWSVTFPNEKDNEISADRYQTVEPELSDRNSNFTPAMQTLPLYSEATRKRLEAEAKFAQRDPEKMRYWDGILNGDERKIPDDIQKKILPHAEALAPEEASYEACSIINRSWAADHLDKSKEELRQDWPEIREELSNKHEVGDDEEELYLALSDDHLRQKHKEAVHSIYEKSYFAGLFETEQPELVDERESLLPEQQDSASTLASHSFEAGRAKRERFTPLAQKLSKGLSHILHQEQGVDSPAEQWNSYLDMEDAEEQLSELSDEDRQVVYHLASAIRKKSPDAHEQVKQGVLGTSMRSLNRSLYNIGHDVGSFTKRITATSLHSLGKNVDEHLGTGLQKQAAEMDINLRTAEEIRRLAHDQLAPLQLPEGNNFIEQSMIDIAAAAPYVALSFTGLGGFGTLMSSGMGRSIEEARHRNPEGNIELQTGAGIIGGAIQESIYFGMNRIGGRMLERTMGNFLKARGQGAASYSLAGLKSAAALAGESTKLLAASKIGQSAQLASHEIAAQFDKTASRIDWQEFGNNMGDIELNMREAAANLPFILIGAGRAALRHFKSPDHIVGDKQMLREWGLNKKNIDQLMKQDNIDQQSDFLAQSLRSSKRWGGLNFIIEAMSSLRLLHNDKFQKFNDENLVRDFLQIPPRSRAIPRKPIKETDNNDAEGLSKLAQKYELKNAGFRRGKALQCYDLLWQKSNLERYISGDPLTMSLEQRWLNIQRGIEKKNEQYIHEIEQKGNIIPMGMRRSSVYVPYAEEARMALLKDRFLEIKELSYQSVLNQMDLDMLQKQAESSEALIERSEKRSRIARFRVARVCMQRMLGGSIEEAYKKLGEETVLTFRNFRNHKFSNNWLQKIEPALLQELSKLKALPSTLSNRKKPIPVEFYHSKHISLGLFASIELLYELIPMTDDYHRSMLQGMSPEQAFSHILLRELELDPAEFPDYPIAQIEASAKDWKLQTIASKNKKNYDIFQKATGLELEMQLGENQSKYWRATLPTTQKTPWYKNKQDAINDLLYSNAQYFRSFGEDQSSKFNNEQSRNAFDITKEVPTYQEKYSGFDDLCTRSVHDLFAQISSRTNSSPESFEVTRMYNRLTSSVSEDVLDARLHDLDSTNKERMLADEFSVTNPHGVTLILAQSYWMQLINTGIIRYNEALDFLQQVGIINAKKYDGIIEKELEDMKKQYSHYLGSPKDFLPDIQLRNKIISQLLSTLSADYMNLTLEHPHTPESVKMWYRLAPLSPADISPDNKKFIAIGDDRKKLIHWSNQMISKRLQNRSDWTQALRTNIKLMQNHPYSSHLEESLGRNENISKEKFWASMFSNTDKPLLPNNELWLILSKPKHTWDRLHTEHKESLRYSFELSLSEDAPLLFKGREANLLGMDQGIALIDDLLRQYPELHEFTEAPNERGKVRRISTLPDQHNIDIIRDNSPTPTLWDPRKVTRSQYRISSNQSLPEAMQQDPRVITGLRFMDRLRCFIAGRAYESPEGIIHKGKIYGVGRDNIPGLDARWKAQYPLEHILTGLDEIDKLCKRGNLDSIRILDIKFLPMEKELDLSPLKRISIYRDNDNLSETIRLMPGESNSTIANSKVPYIVRQRNGAYYNKGRVIRKMSEMHQSLQPLENFRLYVLQNHNVQTQSSLSKTNNQHLLDSLFNEQLYSSDSKGFVGANAEHVELLMRLSEDSGLSDEIQRVGVFQLSPPQLSLLSIIQQMIYLSYGSNEHKKYDQWKRYSTGLQKNKRRLEHIKLSIYDMLEQRQRAYEEHYRQMVKKGIIPRKNLPGRKPKGETKTVFDDFKFIY